MRRSPFGQTGLPTAVAEPVPKAGGTCERLARCRCEKRQVTGRSSIQHCSKIGMDRNSERRPGFMLANFDCTIAHMLPSNVERGLF